MTKKGIVKWFDPKKGFGFIIPEEEGKDIFFHKTDIIKPYPQNIDGKNVEYTEGEGKKGPEAKEVTVL
jgi:CspA family cold shock protein